MEATPRYQPQRHGHPPTLRSQCWWRPKSASASVPSRVAPCFVKVCTTRPIEDEHPLLVAGTYVLARVFVVVLFKEDLIERGELCPPPGITNLQAPSGPTELYGDFAKEKRRGHRILQSPHT